jgi:hypothetical protein
MEIKKGKSKNKHQKSHKLEYKTKYKKKSKGYNDSKSEKLKTEHRFYGCLFDL